jgi:hypothetical protein
MIPGAFWSDDVPRGAAPQKMKIEDEDEKEDEDDFQVSRHAARGATSNENGTRRGRKTMTPGAHTTEHTEHTERRRAVSFSFSVCSVYSVVNSGSFSGQAIGNRQSAIGNHFLVSPRESGG